MQSTRLLCVVEALVKLLLELIEVHVKLQVFFLLQAFVERLEQLMQIFYE